MQLRWEVLPPSLQAISRTCCTYRSETPLFNAKLGGRQRYRLSAQGDRPVLSQIVALTPKL